MVIAVFDASRELTKEDMDIVDIIKDKKSIALLNKTDLPNKIELEDLQKQLGNKKLIATSIAKGVGVEELEKVIKEMFYSGNVEISDDIIVTNVRHKNQLERAKKNISDVLQGIKQGVPLDCVEVDVKSCWKNLGEISGDTVSEDIIDKIFSEFCIGK